MESLWTVILTPKIEKTMKELPKVGITTIEAQTCDESNGALIFRGDNNLSIKTIIAAGQWIMVEREVKDNPNE